MGWSGVLFVRNTCRIPLQDLEIIPYQLLLVAQRLVIAKEDGGLVGIGLGIGIVSRFECIVAVFALPFCGGTRGLRCIGMRLGLLELGLRL